MKEDSKDKKTIFRSTSVVMANTFLSRISGFIRDAIFAVTFGAVAGMDAFLVAFKIPNFMRRLFAEGAFSQAFIPVLSTLQHQKSPKDTKAFIDHVAGHLSLALLVLTVLGVWGAAGLIHIFAPGYSSGTLRFEWATHFLQIMFPYIFFIAMTAFASSILNSYGVFGIPAFAPVLLNVALIIAAWLFAPHLSLPVMALTWGVLVGGLLQLLLQIPALVRLKLLPIPVLQFRDEKVYQVLKLMLPAMFGASVAQINLLLGTLFASFLTVGSVSWLYYADRLTWFPLGIFGVAIGTVVLPHLSSQHAKRSKEGYANTLDWALRTLLLVGVPASVGLALLAVPLIATLFHYGKFTVHDVLMSAACLQAFALGLPAFMLIKVLASGFYAQQNVKTPVKIGIIAVLFNILFSLILLKPLAHVGLALATSLAAIVNAVLLWAKLYRLEVMVPRSGWLKVLLRLGLANASLACLLSYPPFYQSPHTWVTWGWLQRLSHLSIELSVSIVVYFSVLWLLGLRVSDFKPAMAVDNL